MHLTSSPSKGPAAKPQASPPTHLEAQEQDQDMSDYSNGEWDTECDVMNSFGDYEPHEYSEYDNSESEDDHDNLGDDNEGTTSGSDKDSSSDSDEGENITDDPYFRSRATLFDPSQPGNAFVDEQDFDFCELPWAFNDHPSIRHVYIHVFSAAAFDGITHKATASMLQGYRILLESAQRQLQASHPTESIPGLDRFAQTLPTVEK
ncbi:hypothetical protein ARMGADRAFT_1079881 [Armillaria gallica]|uniref:Uncharacterized protein n=1 Tax=Armillaria gallica TaxID=47427 RepID=A0A2H3DWW2_ARMGA|nr:hypothetical protein ARMGADRAFT_1079881 [Armillaria gallica]